MTKGETHQGGGLLHGIDLDDARGDRREWAQTAEASSQMQESSRLTFGYKGDAAACREVAEEAILGEKGLPDPVSSRQHECYLGLGLPDSGLEAKH